MNTRSAPLFRKNPYILAAVLGLMFAPLAHAAPMSRSDYESAGARIKAEFKADNDRCAAMSTDARRVCVEEAKGTEKTARADLEFSYTGKARDQKRAQIARADSAYAIAKEKCASKAGTDKDVCVQEAKTVQAKTLADIKLGGDVSSARAVNADEKRDADYQLALEKCDAVAGDAKDNCIAAAKQRFGKS